MMPGLQGAQLLFSMYLHCLKMELLGPSSYDATTSPHVFSAICQALRCWNYLLPYTDSVGTQDSFLRMVNVFPEELSYVTFRL